MILYKEDWDKYPNAIVDTKTSNTSFYTQAIKYKMMGVSNHAFLLALHDSTLQGVDPCDEDNLTREQKDRILVEIMINPWYFFREVIRVSATGGNVGHLRADRGNIALFFLFFSHIFIILIMIRQAGKSLNTDALKSYALFFGAIKTTITYLTNSAKNRTESIDRIRGLEKNFPKYLRSIVANDISNSESLKIGHSGNKYLTAVAQASMEHAKLVHRGATSPIQHIDESAYITNLEQSLTAMLKSGNAAVDEAKLGGSLYGTIVSTTAGYKDTPHGKYMYDMYCSAAVFTEKMFDCQNADALQLLIRQLAPSSKGKLLIEMNHRQLGKTDEWLRGKIEATESTGADLMTDFFNVWSTTKGIEILTQDDRKRITEGKSTTYYPDISTTEGYTVRWYMTEEERLELIRSGEPLVAGLDPSEALGSDDIAMVITKVSTGETVAAGDFNETNVTIFGVYMADLMIEIPSMTLVVEKRSTGVSIIDSIVPILLDRGINPLTRLFNWAVHNRDLSDKDKAVYRELEKGFHSRDRSVFDRHKKLFGFSTSGSGRTSRTKLYSETMSAAVKYIAGSIKDYKVIRQLLALRVINGRVDHDGVDGDDMVIAWLLAFWLLKNGNNLHLYGIDVNNVLTTVKNDIYVNGKVDLERMKKVKQHNNAMAAINKLSVVISESNNIIEIKESKMLMKRLSSYLDYTLTPSFNIDIYLSKLIKDRELQRKAA